MIINSASLAALRVGFKTEFQSGLDMAGLLAPRVSMTVKSTTGETKYGWLSKMTSMREWIGPRVVNNMSEASYSIVNRTFENTVGVDRNDIEDDNLSQYGTLMRDLGESARAYTEQMVWDALKGGFAANCWDGQFFFDTDHPITDVAGNTVTYANTDGGAGTPWYLLCTNKSVKPIIFQERTPLKFVTKDQETDDNVFTQRQFVYGVETRCATGYGFPQMAWGSKQTLNAANYAIARSAIMSMKGDGGRPLGLMPNLLVVPPALESAGRQLLNSEYGTGGVTNEWKGTAELLVVPWLS